MRGVESNPKYSIGDIKSLVFKSDDNEFVTYPDGKTIDMKKAKESTSYFIEKVLDYPLQGWQKNFLDLLDLENKRKNDRK